MKKTLNKIIEIPCEESEKPEIASRIREYLIENKDYADGYIVVEDNRFEAVDVIIFDGCSNIPEITEIFNN